MTLPPIFAKHRFGLPKAMLPGVIFCMSPDMEAEAQALVDKLDDQDVKNEHFSKWWVEYRDIGILAAVHGERSYALKPFGKRSGPQAAFVFYDNSLHTDDWHKLNDMQKTVSGLYMKAAVVLASYTAREAEVSVNTLTRNKPRAFIRQGDTLRYAPLDSLASASGQHRQRGYERPEEPSGIRMREHDVRGHWRTFPSGVRVWVRPHKRGDASLGRVERVIG